MSPKVGIVAQSAADPGGEARQFEELGYDYVTIGEHVSFNVPASNSFISLAVAAGATERIRLMNSIALVPLYPAALLAKMSAALDVASGGRFSLGVGIGGEYPNEFEACGVPVKERGARTNEALELMELLFAGDHVNFEGRFNTLNDITIAPKPVQEPLPVWISGRKDAAMRRAARFGTGWLPYMYTTDMLADSMEAIGAERDADKPPVEGGLFIWGCVHEDGDTARAMAAKSLSRTYAQDFTKLIDRYCFAGTPDEVAARLTDFSEAGAETMVVSFACPTAHIPVARELFANEVLPILREL